jgi:hypothetical protein
MPVTGHWRKIRNISIASPCSRAATSTRNAGRTYPCGMATMPAGGPVATATRSIVCWQQARAEGLTLVSCDRALEALGVKTFG